MGCEILQREARPKVSRLEECEHPDRGIKIMGRIGMTERGFAPGTEKVVGGIAPGFIRARFTADLARSNR